MDRVTYYRRQAEEAERIARLLSLAPERERYLEKAHGYRSMADERERHLSTEGRPAVFRRGGAGLTSS